MKSKITEWGNSHGIRINSTMMDHLKIQAGEEIEVNLTNKGIEIVKNTDSTHYLESISKRVQDAILKKTDPVKVVEDPCSEADVAYIVVKINPCAPLIREVPRKTKDAFLTLADAKEAARQIIQSSIAEAQKSLSDLRQLGIDNIAYITL